MRFRPHFFFQFFFQKPFEFCFKSFFSSSVEKKISFVKKKICFPSKSMKVRWIKLIFFRFIQRKETFNSTCRDEIIFEKLPDRSTFLCKNKKFKNKNKSQIDCFTWSTCSNTTMAWCLFSWRTINIVLCLDRSVKFLKVCHRNQIQLKCICRNRWLTDNLCNRRTTNERERKTCWSSNLNRWNFTFGTGFDVPSIKLVKFFAKIALEPAIAAAVLLVGRFAQSPIAKTFGNFLCCKVSLTTSTNPLASANGDFAKNSNGCIGGAMCKRSYWKEKPFDRLNRKQEERKDLLWKFSLFLVDRGSRKSLLWTLEELQLNSVAYLIEYL